TWSHTCCAWTESSTINQDYWSASNGRSPSPRGQRKSARFARVRCTRWSSSRRRSGTRSRRCSWTTCSGTAANCPRTRLGQGLGRGPCSTSAMQGLLAAFMNPPADDEAGFNAWYDEEHVPKRLAGEGFLNG